MVKNLPLSVGEVGSIPGLGTKIPCAIWQPSLRVAKKNQQRQKKKKEKKLKNGFNEKSKYFFAIQSKLLQVQGADEQEYFF